MKTLARENCFYSFSQKQKCTLQVRQGEHFKVETYDARRGRLHTPDELFTSAPDWSCDQPNANPCTGPIEISGVKVGDTVRICIHGIELEEGEKGFILHKTDMGICKQLLDQTQAVFGKVNGGNFDLDCGVSLPLRPHIGTLALTPLDAAATAFAGTHGGNMDCRYLEAGSALYLPAQVDGGLLGIGDVHAVMGSGELMGSGIEICATVELSAECDAAVHVDGPVLCTRDSVMTIATADQLQEALELASENMVHLLERYGDCSRITALSLLTTVCDAGICQGCDSGLFSVASVSVSRTYLPVFRSV